VILAIASGAGVGALSLFGYRATLECHRNSAQLIQRQEGEGARLLVTAITRDLRAAESAFADRDWRDFSTDPPEDVSDLVEAAFSQYPYLESFFGWQEGSTRGMTFFNRASRPPAWMPASDNASRYPVTLVTCVLRAEQGEHGARSRPCESLRVGVLEMGGSGRLAHR
jgi:hypothetical protein